LRRVALSDLKLSELAASGGGFGMLGGVVGLLTRAAYLRPRSEAETQALLLWFGMGTALGTTFGVFLEIGRVL
jgi:hypothetical protein